jgi:uncharacterized membrane protein
MNDVETPVRRGYRLGVGRVELVAEDPPQAVRFATLRGNIADLVVRVLVYFVVLAQLADAVTTRIALNRPGFQETNALFRPLLGLNPQMANTLKLGAVLAVILFALSRIPHPRARAALVLALGLSLVGPVLNILTLLH